MNPIRPEPEPFRLLFVCTGNTCRSPLAEALTREALVERAWSHVEVGSAGVGAEDGRPASDGAIRAAARHGLDLSAHRSRPVTPELLAGADLVLTMTPAHLVPLLGMGAGERAALLGAFGGGPDGDPAEAEVPDPFGGSDEAYEETIERLRGFVAGALRRIEPMVAP